MRSIAAVAVVALCAATLWAQERTVEPEFADVFFRLDAGKLVPLERQIATVEGKSSGFIVMNSKMVYAFPGAKSPVRFRSGHPLDFVVRTLTRQSTEDPNSIYVLRKLDSKKKSRELVMSSAHFTPLGGSSRSSLEQSALPVDFSRYGVYSIRMTTSALAAGEYAVSRIHDHTVFCFGVE
jgi:hypothetical protein